MVGLNKKGLDWGLAQNGCKWVVMFVFFAKNKSRQPYLFYAEYLNHESESEVAQSSPTLCDPMD